MGEKRELTEQPASAFRECEGGDPGDFGGRRSAMPFIQDAYRFLLRNNKMYVAFIFTGALVGERIVHNTTGALWELNNQGKLYEHLEGTVIGGPKDDDDE